MKVTIPFLSWTGKAAIDIEIPDNTTEPFRLRAAAEIAVGRGANLRHANLRGANLRDAELWGADLEGADLSDADLGGADLWGAELRGADLIGAIFAGARLDGARFAGAKVGDKTLIGDRPIFMVGPIGSECRYLTSYLTDKGIWIEAGCWSGSIDDFVARVADVHGDNEHGREYRAAVEMIRAHAAIWTPAAESKAGRGPVPSALETVL